MKTLFLLQRPEAWVNIESVWNSLQASPNVENDILVLPYNASDIKVNPDSTRLSCELLGKLGIHPIVWHADINIDLSKYKAAIFTHPYDRERPPELWFKEVSKAIPVTIYIPYGPIVSAGFKNLRLNYHQPTAMHATAVIARSAWEKRMFKLHCPTGDDHVLVSGHPRFDTLLHRLAIQDGTDFKPLINGRLCVLWNSHFSFTSNYSQSSSFSTFDLLGPEILRYAIDNRDWLCLLWRPHPNLYRILESNNWLDKAELSQLETELASLGVIVDKTVDHSQAFYVSDALLTDLGSFFIEYLVTRKPLLALINPEGVDFSEEAAALAEKYMQAEGFKEVKEFIEAVKDNAAYVINDDVIAEHIVGLDGQSGVRVAEIIKSFICTGKPSKLWFKSNILDASKSFRVNTQCTPVSQDIEKNISTPTLDKLINILVKIRFTKQNEHVWRKKTRKVINILRTIVAEKIKQHPLLMKLF